MKATEVHDCLLFGNTTWGFFCLMLLQPHLLKNHAILNILLKVFEILLNSGVDVTEESDGKTPLELANTFLTDGDIRRDGKFSKQGIIDMIEQRIELEPSLMDLTNAMDNVDENPLETLLEDMKEELSKPPPESSDGKKYIQLLDARQNYNGLTPLFFMIRFTVSS